MHLHHNVPCLMIANQRAVESRVLDWNLSDGAECQLETVLTGTNNVHYRPPSVYTLSSYIRSCCIDIIMHVVHGMLQFC